MLLQSISRNIFHQKVLLNVKPIAYRQRFFFPTAFWSLAHAHMIILRDRMNIHAALFLWLANALAAMLSYVYCMYQCTLYV